MALKPVPVAERAFTPAPPSTWEVRVVDSPATGGLAELDELLADGWEPFTVVIGEHGGSAINHERMWLRRPVHPGDA